MKVSIELSPEYSEPYAIIYADKITDNIQHPLDIFGSNESPLQLLKTKMILSFYSQKKYTW